MFLNRRCKRVRATEHAPHGPSRVLERIHGLAEIVKRGLVVVVELSPAPRRRSVDSRQRFETTRPSSRRLRALRRRPRHGPHHHRVLVPACRPRLHTLAPRPRVRCSIVSLVRARAGVATLRTQLQCCPVLGNETALCPHARGNDRCGWLLRARPRRFRLSSTIIKLVELAFCCDRVCSVMEPI